MLDRMREEKARSYTVIGAAEEVNISLNPFGSSGKAKV